MKPVHHTFDLPDARFAGKTITDELAANVRLPADSGVLIQVVRPESPAEAAGLRGGTTQVVVDGETGLLVDPMNPDAVGDAIGVLLDDPKLRARMGRAARTRVKQHYTYEVFGDRIAELLGGLAPTYRPNRG